MSSSRGIAEIQRHLLGARMLRPSYIDRLFKSDMAIADLLHQHHAAVELERRAIDSYTGIQKLIYQSNRSLLDCFTMLENEKGRIERLSGVHASWTGDLLASANQLVHVEDLAKKSLLASFNLASNAQQIIARIEFESVRNTYLSHEAAVSRFLSSFESLSPSYWELIRCTENLTDFTSLPSFVLPSASRELLTAGHAVASLSPEDDEEDEDEQEALSDLRETTSNVRELIAGFDPAFAKTYQGAREACLSGNIDRSRHVLASLREFWSHLLRNLAPDEEVLPWTEGKDDGFVHDGKPTRRARVSYVCREINHEPLSNFLDTDTKAILDYVNFLNRVHALDPGLSDRQLEFLLLRSDSWLTFIIEVAEKAGP